MQLAGARALVTGASGGLGGAITSALRREGCAVVATGRDEARLARLAGRTGVDVVATDLLAPSGPADLMRRLGGQPLDLAVLNAGVGHRAPVDQHDPDVVALLVATNLVSQVELTQALLPLLQRGRQPRLVVVGSIAGALGVPGESVYAATKAALATFAESLRGELTSSGVGVTVLLPGVVRTGFYEARGTAYDRRFPRPVRPEQVARGLVRGLRHDAGEVVVPGWLRLPMVIRAAAPQTYRRLASRWG